MKVVRYLRSEVETVAELSVSQDSMSCYGSDLQPIPSPHCPWLTLLRAWVQRQQNSTSSCKLIEVQPPSEETVE